MCTVEKWLNGLKPQKKKTKKKWNKVKIRAVLIVYLKTHYTVSFLILSVNSLNT